MHFMTCAVSTSKAGCDSVFVGTQVVGTGLTVRSPPHRAGTTDVQGLTMVDNGIRGLWMALAAAAFAATMAGTASAEPFAFGPDKCQECHRSEHQVWSDTKHNTSFRDVHRNDKAKAIAEASGGGDNMRRNEVCGSCHYTETQKDASAKPRVTDAVVCESCHGKASDWLAIHNDYGGPTATRDSETPEHKAQRIKQAADNGMIWSHALFDVASNCLNCHGATRASVEPDVMAKMIDAGHPPGSDFELVRYSQGSVRHRFYPPDVTSNAEMTPPELARTFITGHAAALVKIAGAKPATSPALMATRDKLTANAKAALEAIKGQVPEAAALIADPSEANGRKLIAAIADKDLSGAVGSMLPAKGTYK